MIAIVSVVTLAVVAGAFVAGRVTSDPTASDEYREQAKDLETARSDLTAAEKENDSLDTEVREAQAQVDALVADLPAEQAGDPPALSDGVAIAPRNIRIGVKTRSKECFGSAGCNLTVQIEPSYVGNQDVTTGSWEITYEIRGGEDGPIVETMTLEDGTFTFPQEQSLGTSSSSTTLEAVVTEVSAVE